MNTLDIVIKRRCPACKFEEVVIADGESAMSNAFPDRKRSQGVTMHDGSVIELRTDLRFICCEHCGNPVMYLRLEAHELA